MNTKQLQKRHKTVCFVIPAFLPPYSCRIVTRHRVLLFQVYAHHTFVESSQDSVICHTDFITNLQLQNSHKTPCVAMLTLGPLYSCRTITRHLVFSYQLYDHHTFGEPTQDTVMCHTNFMTTIQLQNSNKTLCFVMLALLPSYSCRIVTKHRVLSC